MITTTYKLGDINQGYQDMRDGKNIRGVLVYEERLTGEERRGRGKAVPTSSSGDMSWQRLQHPS